VLGVARRIPAEAKGLQCPGRNYDTETGGAEEEAHNNKAAES